MPFKKGEQHWKKRKDMQAKIVQPPNEEQQAATIKRHAVGLIGAIEDRYGAILWRKCEKCYSKHGFTTKCVCEKIS